MKTLQDLVLHELAGIYDAEKQLARALPSFEKAAASERLQRILRKHVKETTEHVTKLETVFEHLGAKPVARPCAVTAGLIDAATAIVSLFKGSPVLDAALIGAIQTIEHHEIVTYGCLHEWTELLGLGPAATTLLAILEEEKTANEALTQLARARSNSEAHAKKIAAEPAPASERPKAVAP